jgi:hypothetical protein
MRERYKLRYDEPSLEGKFWRNGAAMLMGNANGRYSDLG